MAKTQTAKTEEEVRAAYTELKAATDAFAAAIRKFEATYNPDMVGLDEWLESIDDTMYDITQDIDETFE